MSNIIRLERINKIYANVAALRNVDLEIDEGEFVTLLGPSGSGKTTLWNIVAGMTTLTSGQVFIKQRNVTQVPPNKRELGMVFQNYALMPHMTIYENIAFPLRVRKCANGEIRRRVLEALDLVRLPQVASRRPHELSGGQQQRVALARALVYKPPIILLDEPLGALDKKLREHMQLELKRLHEKLGVTMLYVTHDQEEALAMSDRIALLNEGEIVQMGTPDSLYLSPSSVFSASFLGDLNMIDATVTSTGIDVSVATRQGQVFRAMNVARAGVGTAVKVIIRPENISICYDGREESYDNLVSGTVLHSVVLGGIVRHYVHVEKFGKEHLPFSVLELNRPDRTALQPGRTLRLGWNIRDMLVLLPENVRANIRPPLGGRVG